MIAIFFGSMASGHLYVVFVVTIVQVMTFKEVIAIANVPSREKRLQFTKSLNWYFLATTMYFLYGESVIYYFKHIVVVDAFLLPFATHHRFISFILYIIGKSIVYPFVFCELTNFFLRVRFLRCFVEERSLQVPIYPICMDTHGAVSGGCASSLHHEQHL
jgi:CDP-diglyceride synthetase